MPTAPRGRDARPSRGAAYRGLALASCLALGCGGDASTPTAGGPPKPARKPAAGQAALSQAAQQAFADRLSEAVYSGDTAAINASIDWQGMIGSVVESIGVTGKPARDMRAGLLRSVQGSPSLASEVARAVEEGGRYDLLRFHTREGRPYALFRLSGGAGINYHDFRLKQRGDQVVAEDVYIYFTGEHLHETLRRQLLPAAKDINKNWLEKLTTADEVIPEDDDRLSEAVQHVADRNGPAALAALRRMSPKAQATKTALLQRCLAATLAGEEELIAAVEEFERRFPGDPAVAVLSIDYLLAQERYGKAIEMIDTLDKSVGGDPFLDTMRAQIYSRMGNHAMAEQLARDAIADAPDIADHWSVLITVLLEANAHDKVYETLNRLEEDFLYEWRDLRELPGYAGFVQSPIGKQWLQEHGYGAQAE